ncbi:hypothetical protein HY251_20170 [bacterium]|nr:hypothetical protein [bacterium]
MVMTYLGSHQGTDEAIKARALGLLERGYKMLKSFECKKDGYEWFGADPGHEALTAMGVMEFTDMAHVYGAVDQGMIDRTRGWLLSKRDGKGGFTRGQRALHTWSDSYELTNAYITWALSQARVTGIEKEVAAVREQALATDDAYFLALAANVLLDTKDPAAEKVLEKLGKKQAEDGAVKGAKTSITCSGGEGLEIETTSLAILAWLRAPAHTASCEKAMHWLLERAKGGRFGSTQSTVLALKAIVAYDAAHATPKKPGAVLLVVDGKVYDEKRFSADQQGSIVLPPFGDALTPGEHKVEVKLVGGTPMPYSLTVRYNALKPASSPSCKVSLSTKLVASEVNEGETVDLRVQVANVTAETIPMTMAIVGLPGGLESRADQLKELVKEGKIDFFETRGREVILYKRGMAASEKCDLVLNLVAAIPGTYRGPASRAYLYYTDEDEQWVVPLCVHVKASEPAAK